MDPILEKINDEIEGHGFANREARLAWAIGSSAVLEARKQMQAYARSDFRIAGTPDQESPASQSAASQNAAAPLAPAAEGERSGTRVAHFAQRGNGEANAGEANGGEANRMAAAERLAALETERQISHLRQSVTLAQLRAFAFIADALIKAERSGTSSAQTMATLRAEYDQLWRVLQPLIESGERNAARNQPSDSEPARNDRSA